MSFSHRNNLHLHVWRLNPRNSPASKSLMNASTEMLKQANIVPQHALRLILGL